MLSISFINHKSCDSQLKVLSQKTLQKTMRSEDLNKLSRLIEDISETFAEFVNNESVQYLASINENWDEFLNNSSASTDIAVELITYSRIISDMGTLLFFHESESESLPEALTNDVEAIILDFFTYLDGHLFKLEEACQKDAFVKLTAFSNNAIKACPKTSLDFINKKIMRLLKDTHKLINPFISYSKKPQKKMCA